ncbi:hypothetical protein GF325_04400, partial [Candidatus Bathyarchaeota archaeon]|nr:hypothetical protein [Candidatus Bathyarchaeota archaeon]
MGCFDYKVLYSAGYIAAAVFGGVFVPLLIGELRRAKHGRAKKKFKLKLKNSFKSPQFVKMIGITKLIQLGLVVGIAFICLYTILDDAINGSPSNGSW